MMKKSTILFTLLLLLPGQNLYSQITISPLAVFLDKNTNVGSFHVSNPSRQTLEVRIGFEFGYPATREDGGRYFNYNDEEVKERFSLIPHLRAFPTTFTLQPDERQTIRLVGRIPQHYDSGVYWSRIRVLSNRLSPPVNNVTEGESSAQVTFQIAQVTAVFAHHGDTETGLTIHNTEATVENERLVVLTDVERTGNSPFLGSIETRILDADNNEIVSRRSSTTVYFRNTRREEFEVGEWPPGEYTVETTFLSSRRDISSRNLLQIPDVTERTTFTIE